MRWTRYAAHGRLAFLLLIPLTVASCTADADDPGERGAANTSAARDTTTAAVLTIADIGLRMPESVVHDPDTDVYIVSNVNGDPLDHDDNGFISRLTPDGQVIELKWIDGAAADVTLHGPKGLAISAGQLLVADIDSVRLFDLDSGAPQGAWGIDGATLLNDLSVAADGTVYVSDSGVRMGEDGVEPSGSAGVYRFDASGRATPMAQGAAIESPNGVLAIDGGVLVVDFAGDVLYRVARDGEVSTVATLPAGQLDGIARTNAGDLLVSSWEAQSVFRVDSVGRVTTLVEDVESPADIGYDTRRDRVLIPLLMHDRLEVRPVR